MNIKFKDKALDQLSDFPVVVQRRILNKLKFFASTADPLKFSHSIKGKNLGEYRFRIGDYRVIFDVNNGEIVILKSGEESLLRKNIQSGKI